MPPTDTSPESVNETVPRPARPWLAALLSVLQLGLGHLYAWHPRAALAIWLSGLVLLVPAARGFSSPTLGVSAISLVLFVAAYVGVAVHAWRTARARNTRRPSRARLLGLLVAALVIASLVATPLQSWVKRNVAEAFRIPSGAMEPTVLVGDWLFVRPVDQIDVRRDQIFTFRNEGTVLLKRAVGLPGDTLEMRAGQLYRNATIVPESYTQQAGEAFDDDSSFQWQAAHRASASRLGSYKPTTDDWGPIVVSEGTLFFLGDNRHMSRDSRFYGFIPRDSVLGRPTIIYFSWAPEGGPRWDRLGLVFTQSEGPTSNSR